MQNRTMGAVMLKTSRNGLGLFIWFLLFSLLSPLSGCGGGGGGGESAPKPSSPVAAASLQSSTMSYDFGEVTLSNSPAAKMITFSNSGDAPLVISNIKLNIELIGAGFSLDLDSASGFCGSISPTLAVGGSCSVAIGFAPNSGGNYHGTLTVLSNDPDTPELNITIDGAGSAVAVAGQIVKINQVVPSCLSSQLTAYVSVTDQVGYPIPDLTMSNFKLTESSNGSISPPPIVQPLEIVKTVSAPISIALVMDYSSSITDYPDKVKAMEDGVISFINRLGPNDEAEIIKFDADIEVVQPFTAGDAAGKAALIAKVQEPWDHGIYSLVHDAVYLAVTDTAARQTERRGVIILSDFVNNAGTGNTSNTTPLAWSDNAIASSVPVYIVGLGVGVDSAVTLTTLTSETGGQYFDVANTNSLRTIYQQQAQTLFVDQYVLSYDSGFGTGTSATLTVGVSLDGLTYVSDSRIPESCQ